MDELAPRAYGLLLTIDGYGASPEACADKALLRRLLSSFPAHLGMRPLGTPHIEYVDEPGIRGYSGFTFIMESHISIHTYAERGFVTADIYSCKPFDTERAAAKLAEAFSLDSFDRTVLIRGHRFAPERIEMEVRPHMRL